MTETPEDYETYEGQKFNLTGLTLTGATFVRCIVGAWEKGGDTVLNDCLFDQCYLVGDLGQRALDDGASNARRTMAEWAERVGVRTFYRFH